MSDGTHVAFLDTNVLMGTTSTDILMTLATGFDPVYEARWNSHVIRELRRHLPERLASIRSDGDPEAAFEKADGRIRQMERALPGANAKNWERHLLVAEEYVNDPDDAEILAGAIASDARFIVTQNVKDFRRRDIEGRFGIRTVRESAFLKELLEDDPAGVQNGLIAMTSEHRRPPRNLRELCEQMGRIPELSDFGRELENRIRRSYEDRSNAIFQTGRRGRQGRDGLGRYTRVYGGYEADVAAPEGYDRWWGPDGNGPEL